MYKFISRCSLWQSFDLVPNIMKGQEAAVMTNGWPSNSNNPNPLRTARLVDRTPQHATHTLVLTLSDLQESRTIEELEVSLQVPTGRAGEMFHQPPARPDREHDGDGVGHRKQVDDGGRSLLKFPLQWLGGGVGHLKRTLLALWDKHTWSSSLKNLHLNVHIPQWMMSVMIHLRGNQWISPTKDQFLLCPPQTSNSRAVWLWHLQPVGSRWRRSHRPGSNTKETSWVQWNTMDMSDWETLCSWRCAWWCPKCR